MSNFKSVLIASIFLFATLFILPSNVLAQQGCCSHHLGIAYCNGFSYVCNDGSVSPTCGCFLLPPPFYRPVAPKPPDVQASFTYSPNPDGTFNVLMNWNNVPNTGFSIALHNYKGGDPGPDTDTTNNYWTFYNILPGTYYADMKVGVNGTWSTVLWWEVKVPKWYAPPVVNTSSPTVTTDQTDIGPIVLVLLILFFVGVACLFTAYKVLKKFIQFFKNRGW